MPEIDVERLKAWLSERKHKQPDYLALRQPKLHQPWQRPADGRAIGKVLESVLNKAGVDVAKLDKIRADNQTEARRLLERQKTEAARHRAGLEAAYRQGLEARRTALQLLKKPFLSYFLSLDEPLLIWEMPHPELNIFIDQHTEPMNNWVQVLVNTDNGSDSTQFIFYFLWSNDSQYAAVVNVSTSLVINGLCELFATTGIFSGDANWLSVQAELSILRWSGWGNDPVTGQSLDQTYYPYYQQTQYQSVASLSANGGGLFGDVGIAAQMFANQPFDLSYALLPIPAGAVTMFEVALPIAYGFTQGGGNIGDNVTIEFSNNERGYLVRCPGVLLEVLTPASTVM